MASQFLKTIGNPDSSAKPVRLSDIAQGGLFEYAGFTYVKLSPPGEAFAAVVIDSRNYCPFTFNAEVRPVTGKFHRDI